MTLIKRPLNRGGYITLKLFFTRFKCSFFELNSLNVIKINTYSANKKQKRSIKKQHKILLLFVVC